MITGTEIFDTGTNMLILRSRNQFDPLYPEKCKYDIGDIAHALSMQCRFGGHTSEFYSVAQHCVLVSKYCDPKDALWGLLHDASEAFLVDLPRPIKYATSVGAEYRKLEKRVQKAICDHFHLPEDEPCSVKLADQRVGLTEMQKYFPGVELHFEKDEGPIVQPEGMYGWGQEYAKEMYLQRFLEVGLPSS